MATATIIEPTGESDTPLKFTAGLLLGIPFDCELKDLTDVTNIRIRVSSIDPISMVIYCLRYLKSSVLYNR